MTAQQMERECPFDQCNMPEGHNGPHGMAVPGGLVFAPYGGGEGTLYPVENADIQCDCCGSGMRVLRGSKGGGQLRCTQCTQKYFFGADGNSSSTVIAKLYPSMKEDSPLFREYVEHRRSGWLFNARARILLGLISEPEYEERVANANRAADEWHASHPIKQPWYKRFFLAVSR